MRLAGFLSVSIVTAAFSGIVACGGNVATTAGGGGITSTTASTGTSATSSATTTTTASSSGAGLASPPPPGAPQPPDGTGMVTFAISKIFLGDVDPDGTPDAANGWTHFGYNIDGVTPGNPSSFCKPVGNASPATVHNEGINGIENAYGHLVLPIVKAIDSNASAKANQSIEQGLLTGLMSLNALGPASNDNPIASQFSLGANLMSTPKFDGSDVWPIWQGSTVTFPQSYLVGNTWVSHPLGTIQLSMGMLLPVGTANSRTIPINHAIVSMNLDAAHQKVTGGIISGVIPTQTFQTQFQLVAGSIDPSLCSGPTTQTILMQIAQASDIMQDGTQDPSKTCDGISIGLGFDAALVQLGAPVQVSPPPNPCAAGG